ncbi:hypothetical protein HKD37_01G001003 [Glycine soja]
MTLEDLIKGYNQLLFASACVFEAYRKLNKCFQHLEREHEDLKKIHQAHLVDFILEITSHGNVQDTFIYEEVKELLDEKISRGRKKNSNLWTGCQHYKKFSSNLNYKLKGREILKELPLEIVQRNPKDKFGHGSKIEKVVHGEELTICYFCGKVGGSAPRNTTCLCGCEIYRQVHWIVK